MKKKSLKKSSYVIVAFGIASLIAVTGCNKDKALAPAKTETVTDKASAAVLLKDLQTIQKLGFGVSDAIIVPGGYVVEGDILLTRKNLDASFAAMSNQQGQYSTQYKIATSGVRTINVALSDDSHTANFNTAFNNTVSDLNNLKLSSLKFVRVTDLSKSDITVSFTDLGPGDGTGVPLGQDASFIDPNGNPGNSILLSTNAAAGFTTASVSYVQSILDHEFGHAIGFRHTDYADRLYGLLAENNISTSSSTENTVLTNLTKQDYESTHGTGTWARLSSTRQAQLRNTFFSNNFNEPIDAGGNSRATHLYGTPLTPTYNSSSSTFNTATDPQSIMLSYQNPNNLTFDAYDNIALLDLYGTANQIALIKSYLTTNGAVTSAANAKRITTVAQVVTAVKALN